MADRGRRPDVAAVEDPEAVFARRHNDALRAFNKFHPNDQEKVTVFQRHLNANLLKLRKENLMKKAAEMIAVANGKLPPRESVSVSEREEQEHFILGVTKVFEDIQELKTKAELKAKQEKHEAELRAAKLYHQKIQAEKREKWIR